MGSGDDSRWLVVEGTVGVSRMVEVSLTVVRCTCRVEKWVAGNY